MPWCYGSLYGKLGRAGRSQNLGFGSPGSCHLFPCFAVIYLLITVENYYFRLAGLKCQREWLGRWLAWDEKVPNCDVKVLQVVTDFLEN